MAVMTKRGSMLVFISIISIILAFIAFVMLPGIAKAFASGEVALKTATSRDIALILDAMYASPYDTRIEYDFDLSDFIVEISEKKVTIYNPSFSIADDPTAAEYPFVPIGSGPDVTLIKPEKIIFEKKEGILTITK